jgi:hypothetical protein
MVSKKSVEKQLKRLKFNSVSWGRAEIAELPSILLENEKIDECVNGIYEGGFALLVATDIRLLLIDKKPLRFLTVEDLRYDMITELDYSHRLMGAQISIAAGSKNLKFRSYNQPRLRELISIVQSSMAQSKKKQSASQEDQGQHLAQINQQLQAYLLATHQQQQVLQKQLDEAKKQGVHIDSNIEPVKPPSELADYLYAQSLLMQHEQQSNAQLHKTEASAQVEASIQAQPAIETAVPTTTPPSNPQGDTSNAQLADLYAEGVQEIFGRQQSTPTILSANRTQPEPKAQAATDHTSPIDINALSIAYSKLPMALRNRKFGRPSFNAHSQQTIESTPANS